MKVIAIYEFDYPDLDCPESDYHIMAYEDMRVGIMNETINEDNFVYMINKTK